MGHVRNGQGIYGRLQKRLDRFPIGAPPAEALYEILKRLFTEEEAAIGCRMPIRFADIAEIARRTGKTPEALRPVLDRMAEKGLVMDFERRGKTVYILSPTVGGFFEFAFMRVRDDIPQKEIARHMIAYAHEDPALARSVFAGKVQWGRTLVHESALDPDDATRILDYERATHLVRDAKAHAVSLCYCRHVQEHAGTPCAKPMEVCTTLNATAEFLVRRGLARRISREEALDVFAATRDAGLVHIGDNVKKRPAFVCHCCGCCCAMLSAINRFRMFDAVVTSPFIAAVDASACSGCGLCAKRCPVKAIATRGTGREARAVVPLPEEDRSPGLPCSPPQPGPRDGRAVVDGDVCLGCGVCEPACAKKALRMAPRTERVLVPENAWRRTVTMAIERGRFQDLLFDDFDRLDYAALRAVTRIIVSLPPVKKALLSEQVQSRFLKAIAG